MARKLSPCVHRPRPAPTMHCASRGLACVTTVTTLGRQFGLRWFFCGHTAARQTQCAWRGLWCSWRWFCEVKHPPLAMQHPRSNANSACNKRTTRCARTASQVSIFAIATSAVALCQQKFRCFISAITAPYKTPASRSGAWLAALMPDASLVRQTTQHIHARVGQHQRTRGHHGVHVALWSQQFFRLQVTVDVLVHPQCARSSWGGCAGKERSRCHSSARLVAVFQTW